MYTSLAEDNEALNKRVAELETERDRLREALKNVASLAAPYFTDGPQRVAISEARAALKEDSNE